MLPDVKDIQKRAEKLREKSELEIEKAFQKFQEDHPDIVTEVSSQSEKKDLPYMLLRVYDFKNIHSRRDEKREHLTVTLAVYQTYL